MDHIKIFTMLRQMAEAVFLKQGFYSPMIQSVNKDGDIDLHIVAMASDSQKDSVEEMMIGLAKAGAKAICFVSEAWTLPDNYIKNEQQYQEIYSNGGPSSHPMRQEILSAAYFTPDIQIVAKAPILRDEPLDPWSGQFVEYDDKEDKPKLGEWDISDVIPVKEKGKLIAEGRFANFWDKNAKREAFKNN